MSTNVGELQAKRGLEAHGHKITTIASFGDNEYYLDPAAAEVISFQPSPPWHDFFDSLEGDLHPCTVINRSKDQLDNEDFHIITSDFTLHDDVWTPAFLEGETSYRLKVALGGVAYPMTPHNSRHTTIILYFETLLCAKRRSYFLGSTAFSFAGRSLCDPAINWRSISCIATI